MSLGLLTTFSRRPWLDFKGFGATYVEAYVAFRALGLSYLVTFYMPGQNVRLCELVAWLGVAFFVLEQPPAQDVTRSLLLQARNYFFVTLAFSPAWFLYGLLVDRVIVACTLLPILVYLFPRVGLAFSLVFTASLFTPIPVKGLEILFAVEWIITTPLVDHWIVVPAFVLHMLRLVTFV